MQVLSVTGGAPLHGTVTVHGAKNSVLPILAAATLCREPCVLHNCPQIEDVSTALKILQTLGCRTEQNGGTLYIDPRPMCRWEIGAELAGRMRSSIVFLGALLARMKRATIALPGGCPLGSRPIDLHLQALSRMGADFSICDSCVISTCEKLHGASITLPYPSVGATENVILAAMGCDGCVLLEHAAMEPEIADLIGFLRSAGAQIDGEGSSSLRICGGALHGTSYTIMPDRIETATYLCAAAACGGDVTLKQTAADTLMPVVQALREAGCRIEEGHHSLRICSSGALCAPAAIATAPYPGFPTDAQAPLMAALLKAKGESVLEETVFDNRLRHVLQFRKMGAQIALDGRRATVRGVRQLHGAPLVAEDLRAGAAMVIAALSAQGSCTVSGVKHIKRGYDKLAQNLKKLGADIEYVEIF